MPIQSDSFSFQIDDKVCGCSRVVSTMLISVLGTLVPELFTNDVVIQRFLHQLMRSTTSTHFTHVCIGKHGSGANQFNLLAVGTTLSTLCPCCYSRVPRMSRVYGVEELSLCFLDGS